MTGSKGEAQHRVHGFLVECEAYEIVADIRDAISAGDEKRPPDRRMVRKYVRNARERGGRALRVIIEYQDPTGARHTEFLREVPQPDFVDAEWRRVESLVEGMIVDGRPGPLDHEPEPARKPVRRPLP